MPAVSFSETPCNVGGFQKQAHFGITLVFDAQPDFTFHMVWSKNT